MNQYSSLSECSLKYMPRLCPLYLLMIPFTSLEQLLNPLSLCPSWHSCYHSIDAVHHLVHITSGDSEAHARMFNFFLLDFPVSLSFSCSFLDLSLTHNAFTEAHIHHLGLSYSLSPSPHLQGDFFLNVAFSMQFGLSSAHKLHLRSLKTDLLQNSFQGEDVDVQTGIAEMFACIFSVCFVFSFAYMRQFKAKIVLVLTSLTPWFFCFHVDWDFF